MKVNRNGFPRLENSELEANHTAALLTEWCGFEVSVHPVIAVAGTWKITHDATPGATVTAGSPLPAQQE